MWLTTSLVTRRKPAFLHYFWGKHNYQALFVFRPWTEFMSHFFPILVIILQFFTEQSCKKNCTHSIFRTIEARASLAQTNYKNNIIKSNLYREFTIRWDCSVRSICHYVVRRLIMGFEQKLIYFNSIYKITRRQNVQCELSRIWMNADNEEEVSESFLFAFYF